MKYHLEVFFNIVRIELLGFFPFWLIKSLLLGVPFFLMVILGAIDFIRQEPYYLRIEERIRTGNYVNANLIEKKERDLEVRMLEIMKLEKIDIWEITRYFSDGYWLSKWQIMYAEQSEREESGGEKRSRE